MTGPVATSTTAPMAPARSASASQPAPPATAKGAFASTAVRRSGSRVTSRHASPSSARIESDRRPIGDVRGGSTGGNPRHTSAATTNVDASSANARVGPNAASAPPAAIPSENTTLHEAASIAPAIISSSRATTLGKTARSAGAKKAVSADRIASNHCSAANEPSAAAPTIPSVRAPSPRLVTTSTRRRS